MPLTRRELLARAAWGALAALAGCGREAKSEVNFFNWSKYIGPDTLARFTSESGIPVNYEEFADEEEMFAKLRSGAAGYDLVVGTDYMIERLKALNLIEAIPAGALTRLGNIAPRFRNPPYDPEGTFTVPYLWGSTGIAFNKSKVSKRPTSWRDLWDPRYAGRLSMLDNARDCVSVCLLLLGQSEDTKDPAVFERVKKLLMNQKPMVKQYSSTTYTDALIAGEVDLAMAWSGDVLQAARENPQIDYVIPSEGGYMWGDSLCLARGAPHRAETLRLMDFLLDGEVAAGIANEVRYATPNQAALPFLDPALKRDPRVFPPPETARRLRFHAVLDPEASQLWSETFSDVKIA